MTLYIDFDPFDSEMIFERRTPELEAILGKPTDAGSFGNSSLEYYQGLVESLSNRVFVPMLAYPWSFIPEPPIEYEFQLLDSLDESDYYKKMRGLDNRVCWETGAINIKLIRTEAKGFRVETYIEVDIATAQEKDKYQKKSMERLKTE